MSTLKPEGIKKLVDFLKFPNHTEMIELGKNISKIRTEESKKNTIISLSLSALVGIITGVASWFKLNKEKPKSDIQIKNNQEQQIKELNSKTPIPAIQESVKSEDSIVNITESDDESSKLNDLKTKNSNLTKDKAKFYSNIIASFLIGTMGAFYSGMAFYLCLPDKSVALSKKYSGLHFSNYNKALATSHILTDLKDREWENTDSIIVTFDKKISKDYAFVNTRFAKKGFNYSEDEKADIGKTFEKLKEN